MGPSPHHPVAGSPPWHPGPEGVQGMPTLSVALQEWAVACQALGTGTAIALVRKGGIHDRGGRFSVEHQRFLLLETRLHQDAGRCAPRFRHLFEEGQAAGVPTPGRLVISLWAEIAAIWTITGPQGLAAFASESLWSPEELARRFAYRQEPWLHVLGLQVWRLSAPVPIEDRPAYAGCRSWIPLDQEIPLAASQPVLEHVELDRRLSGLAEALGPPMQPP